MTYSSIAVPLVVSTAFSPGHITGFFEKPTNKKYSDVLYYGPKGAGFSFKKGVTSIVEIYPSKKKQYQIFINGSLYYDAEVSNWISGYYLDRINSNYLIKINHNVDIPIGFGLGASGAAALSLSYALNEALCTGLDRKGAAQIAHIAEIECHTGLGTVISEFYGGLEIRTSFGAPGIGQISKLKLTGYKAIILCINPIPTKKILATYSNQANVLGNNMVEKLFLSPNVQDFLKMSREFSEFLRLTKGICSKPIKKLNDAGIECSVALFGETVFTLVPEEESSTVISILQDFPGTLIVSDIDNNGASIKGNKYNAKG